jgi:hypothetical protein
MKVNIELWDEGKYRAYEMKVNIELWDEGKYITMRWR